MLGVSIAVARAAANELDIPLYRHLGGFNAKVLPVPMFNIFNGGKHADSGSAIQEFMIRPVGATCFADAIQMGYGVFQSLKGLLKAKGFSTAVGDEGGFAPKMPGGPRAVLDTIMEAISDAGFKPGTDITLALDCAASEIYQKGEYNYGLMEKDGVCRNMEEQVAFLEQLSED